ncbi:MAG: MBL fold metallo-hydrolase [Ruminiclostridium sp.]|nr:MBL fold metallo-hydrolase [Ruminiclostridium sp.]
MRYQEITPRIWHIEEDYRAYCTLVRGEKLAILWDTGQGKEDLRDFLTRHVATDCLVLNSHGHDDHIGGNHRFSKVYANREDWHLLQAFGRMTMGSTLPYEVEDLLPGTVFDLGGIHGCVVSLAGHTRGSVGLLLEEDRLLLAGDALNPTLLMLGGECAPVSVLRETLRRAEELPFDRYLASHYPTPQPKKTVRAHLRHLDCLRIEAPSHPGPYGPQVCRSIHRDADGRSVIFIERGLVEGRE